MKYNSHHDYENKATSVLLCLAFLDDGGGLTTVADEELNRRGYSNKAIKVLRMLCSIGLWTQSFVWEEWHLDLYDVIIGYGLLICFWSIPISIFLFIVFSVKLFWPLVVFIAGFALIFCGLFGVSRRKFK